MKKGALVLFCLAVPLCLFADGTEYGRVLRKGKWGAIGPDGKVLLQPQFDRVYNFHNGYSVVTQNGKRAYLDSNGKFITDFAYDSAYHFFNEFAVVEVATKYGLIDKTGKQVVDPTQDLCMDFGDFTIIGRRSDAAWIVLNARGQEVARIDANYNSCRDYSARDQLITAKGGKLGVIDQNGAVVIPFSYSILTRVHDRFYIAGGQSGPGSIVLDRNGLAVFESRSRPLADYFDGFAITGSWSSFGLIDAGGKEILPGTYQSLSLDEAGFALGWTGKWEVRVFTILDLKSRQQKTFSLGYMWGFDERGQSPYMEGSKYGVIDKDGKIIVTPQYDYIESYSEDLAAVQVGDKWGYLDRSGKMVIQPQFGRAYAFSEGLAVVIVGDYEGGKRGYIDKQGRFVIEPAFDWAYSFDGGMAHVAFGDFRTGTFGYINKAGEYLWDPSN